MHHEGPVLHWKYEYQCLGIPYGLVMYNLK